MVNTKHGQYNTRLYNIWEKMKARCDNPNETGFSDYGGRGISYDESWNNFIHFYNDMYQDYAEHLYLDRIDYNKNYCKENCRWVSSSMNAFNQRKRNTNKSGKSGIVFVNKVNKWRATITKDYKQIHLGYFIDFDAAVKAREQAEVDLFGERKDK